MIASDLTNLFERQYFSKPHGDPFFPEACSTLKEGLQCLAEIEQLSPDIDLEVLEALAIRTQEVVFDVRVCVDPFGPDHTFHLASKLAYTCADALDSLHRRRPSRSATVTQMIKFLRRTSAGL